jgi:hypothetical protein
MRIFYVIYLHDGIAVDCIEAIRLLADPYQRKAAHITVRGPFPNKIKLNSANKKLSGNRIVLNGVSHFISDKQNTVYFTCMGTKLRMVWNKPDFPFNPHVTIYDGSSKSFALQLYEILSKYKYFLGFYADRITPLISKSDSRKSCEPRFDEGNVNKVIGETLESSKINCLSEERRLELIDRLCSFLNDHSLRTEEQFLWQDKSDCGTVKDTLAALKEAFTF